MPVVRRRLGGWLAAAAVGLLAVGAVGYFVLRPAKPARPARAANAKPRLQSHGDYALWWEEIPDKILAERIDTGLGSNIRPADYVGPDACKNCHKKQYEDWSSHAHRWMNARIDQAIVKGDFNDRTTSYLGGEVTCFKDGDAYRMRLVRGDVQRDYVITQTIGSRFFQYYVGKQLSGPEPADHPLYSEDHVLPLGYWLDREEWVPGVHVHDEVAEDRRHDPFEPRKDWPVGEFSEYAGKTLNLYRSQCNFCHTTFPVGDMMVRHQPVIGRHVPARLDVSLSEYVQAARPELWPAGRAAHELTDDEYASILKEFRNFDARTHAVTLGISCEACHLGAKEHASGALKKPRFFPHAAEAAVRGKKKDHDLGRTHDNLNWACGRCHAGDRPQFAGGMSTWNSTEFTDAARGACYSQLTCVRCHNPHQTLGAGWSQTPVQDDAICLSCHQSLEPAAARTAHTHHAQGSEGSRCMNCHMPRINEGLQEVVRTHTIFSPTNPAMIEANEPNACNQCHVDRPIDWTLTHLQKWYGKTYSEGKLRANYPERDQPAALGWLHSEREAVRLVAADSLARARADWALPELLTALDDPYLLNRQFARVGLEAMLDAKLSDFGYRFYMTPQERKQPLQTLRERFLPAQSSATR